MMKTLVLPDQYHVDEDHDDQKDVDGGVTRFGFIVCQPLPVDIKTVWQCLCSDFFNRRDRFHRCCNPWLAHPESVRWDTGCNA